MSGGGHPARILRRKLRRDLGRQRWQFVAVVVTIVLGVTMYVASYDAFLNLTASYNETYERLAFADLTVSGGDLDWFAESARDTDGVTAVTRRVQADVPFQLDGGEHKLVGRMVGMPAGEQPEVDQVGVVSGSYLDPSRPDGVLVETHMAEHFDLEPGDELEVFLRGGFQQVEMLGEVTSPEYIWPARSRQDLITTPDDFGVLFVPEDLVGLVPAATQVDQALVRYADGADRSRLDDELTSTATDLGATDVFTAEEQPSNAALSEDLQGFSQISYLFPALFLTAAGLATFILLNRVVYAQRPQIGTLVANGVSQGQVLGHYVSYGLIVGVGGAVIGVAIGVPLGGIITGSYTSALSIPDTVTRFHPLTPFVGLAFGLVMGVLAAWAPARAAVHVTPAEAMRGPVPTGATRASLLERIMPLLRRLPIRWRMSIRGIGRSKRRSLSTVIGVVLALTLILASWGMIDTTQLLVERQFDDIQHNDVQVFFRTAVDDSVVGEVGDVEGVERAEEVLTLGATARSSEGQYATQLQAFEQGTEMHSFLGSDDDELTLPGDGVLAGVALQSQIGIGEGDEITLAFPSLGTSISTTVAGFVDEPLGTFVYMARDQLAQSLADASPSVSVTELQSPAVASVMAIYASGADAGEVRSRINQLPDVAALVTSNALQDLFDQFLGLFYAFVGIMLVFGSVLAFALIFNTISVNIAERSVELATMRANGLSLRQVNRLLTGENLLLTLVGIPVGLAVGWLAASAMMQSYTSDLFQFELRMRPTTPTFAALAVVAVTLISQWPGLRALRRLDIATVVRERSQ